MANWRDQLKIAKFRNIEFFVQDVTMQFGRRGTVHEFPQSDEPFAEDTGRKAREFSINAYVFGDDYIAKMLAIIKSIESDPTPGTLIHPTLGQQFVKPGICSVVYNDLRVGHEFLNLKFIEAGTILQPSESVNTEAQVERGVIKFGSSTVEQYDEIVIRKGIPDYAANSAIDIVNGYLDQITEAIGFGERIPANLDEAVKELNKYKNVLPTAIFDSLEFMQSTVDLYDRISTIWDTANAEFQYVAHRSIVATIISFIFQPDDSTPDRVIEANNNEQLEFSFRGLALAQMVQASSNKEYDSSNDAFDRQLELLGFFNTEIEAAGVAGFELQRRDLIDMRSAMIDDLSAKGASLPEETTINLQATQPYATLGNELYGDAFRGEEIVDNNKVENPLFLPPLVDLIILTA